MRRSTVLRRAGLALSTIALAGMTCLPCAAFASDAAVPAEKSETVYVYANADGTVKNIEVSTILKNPGEAAELADSSNLNDIEGKDDKTYTGSGNEIVWKAEGENVEYTGTSTAAVPISMRVSYTLDGQRVDADQIAGKSGKVVIRYDFSNESTYAASVNGSSESVYTPFTCVTALMLDGDDFKNISVVNAKMIEDGNDVIIAGYGMPGLKQSLGSLAEGADVPDYFTVTADVENFELKSSMTIVTAGLMSDVDADSLGIEMQDASALNDAMGQLISGSNTLTEGLNEIASGVESLESGADSLLQLSAGIASGADKLAGENGLQQLAIGAGGLQSQLEAIPESIAEAKMGLNSLDQALIVLAEQRGKAEELGNASAVLAKYESEMDPEDYAVIQGALKDGVVVAKVVDEMPQSVGDAPAQLDELSNGISAAAKGAGDLKDGLAVAESSASDLALHASTLNNGLNELSSAMPSIAEALRTSAEGSQKLTDGMQAFNDEGVTKLVDTMNSEYGSVIDRVNALSSAAKSYDNFGGITEGTAGTVKFVFEVGAVERQ